MAKNEGEKSTVAEREFKGDEVTVKFYCIGSDIVGTQIYKKQISATNPPKSTSQENTESKDPPTNEDPQTNEDSPTNKDPPTDEDLPTNEDPPSNKEQTKVE